MKAVVTLDGNEDQVRTARRALAGSGLLVVAMVEEPPDARSAVRIRRLQTTAFDGYEILVLRHGGARKVWGALAIADSGGSEAMLAVSLIEYLDGVIDPTPVSRPPTTRRRRRQRFLRAG